MNKIIIYDFEVFKYDTLFGTLIINLDNNNVELFQTWNIEQIRKFYLDNKSNLFVGWNNWNYDDLILEAIVNKTSPYFISKKIIDNKNKFIKCNLPIYSYDLLDSLNKKVSLKLTELIIGKKIHTSEIDFNIDRPLLDEEKKQVEDYNKDDLLQTKYNQKLEYSHVKPIKYPNLIIKNIDVLDYYLNEKFVSNINFSVKICNITLNFNNGGLHYAEKKFHADKVIYYDVSGFYNLIMINYNLLSRAIPENGKKLYIDMHFDRVKMSNDNPKKKIIKVLLLKVFGCTISSLKTNFYDPYVGRLIPIVGQMYIFDLLEKLEGLIKIVNLNTDGFAIIPYNWNDLDKISSIINEWSKRTGFTLKQDYKYNLYQRDVNCYFWQDKNGNIEFKGDSLKNFDISEKAYARGDIFSCKEPPIIAQGIINYFINKITPKDFVEQNKENLLLFQYICKKGAFDYNVIETFDLLSNSKLNSTKLQGIDRAFAYNNIKFINTIYQYKTSNGKITRKKLAHIPNNVFIYNKDLFNAYDLLKDKIDYQYYIERIKQKIKEFEFDNPEENDILKYLLD